MKFKSRRRGFKNPHTSKNTRRNKRRQKVKAPPRFTHVVAMCLPFETPLKDHIGTETECRIQSMLMNTTVGARSNAHYAVMTRDEFILAVKKREQEQEQWAEAGKELAHA